MSARKGLGRGLSNLLPDSLMTTIEDGDDDQLIVKVAINRLRPNPNQPRRDFATEELEGLAASIKEQGIIQPLTVVREENGYTIVSGERRWRASEMAGIKEVPVMVRNLDPQQVMEIALIENIQRVDLNAIEEAQAYAALMESFNLTHGEIAIRVGKGRTAVTNSLRLLNLPQPLLDHVSQGELTAGHGRALLGLEEETQMLQVAKKVIEEQLSVRETEALVKKIKTFDGQEPTKSMPKAKDPYIENLENWLVHRYNTKVEISDHNHKGKITLSYHSLDELNSLLDLLGYEE